jgi:seryl-tRNA synthetase
MKINIKAISDLQKKEKEELAKDIEEIEVRNERELNEIMNVCHKIRGSMGRISNELVQRRTELNKYYNNIKKEL